jgi:hypothetical protein
VAPPFYSFHSITASFTHVYDSFGEDLPSITKIVLESSATIAADLRIALGAHLSLLIALAITTMVRKAFFGVAICNLVILLTLAVALYAPIFILWSRGFRNHRRTRRSPRRWASRETAT